MEPTLEEQLLEMASSLEAVMLENEELTKIITADAGEGMLATLRQKNKELAALRERVDGLMVEKNAAIRDAANWKRRAKQ